MNKYVALYRSKKLDVESDTSYHAQLKAAALFKAKHSYDVTVMLYEQNGSVVIHNGGEL